VAKRCGEDRLNTVLGLVATVAGLTVSIYFGRNSARQLKERVTLRRFMRVRQVMSQDSLGVSRTATKDCNQLVLAKEGWILDSPCSLDELKLRLTTGSVIDDHTEHLRILRRYLPTDAAGKHFDHYHEAVAAFDRPALWFNANTYRLLGVERTRRGLRLHIGPSRYWDCFDYAEGLRHEAAHHYLASDGRRIGGRFRKRLDDPFDFATRHCGIGFVTLTLRATNSGATFYLHRRGNSVAVGQNITSLVPAGEFQPSDDSTFALHRDLDLWLAMMREYAEELLGIDEMREARGAPIDYDTQSPFQQMQAAKSVGLIRPHLLGIGLDPASWKAQVYTVCVFDASTFDEIFADMPVSNLEGIHEVPTHRRQPSTPLRGWDFAEKTIDRYLHDTAVSPSVKLVIELAWQNRSVLLP
jgi:hypothetical protein